MEMEPVSRHLGDYCLEHKPELKNEEAYCIFVTTFLNTNVISDFRARRFMEYYNAAGTDYVTGLKILPMQTAELKKALKSGITYPQIYKLLDQANNTPNTIEVPVNSGIVLFAGINGLKSLFEFIELFLLRKDSILENNIVQTIGSAGESVAAGAIFTLPALFLWAVH